MKRFLRSKLAILLLAAAAFRPAIALAEEITVTVGDWPPYISQGMKNNGAISHLISDIFADEGIEVTIRFLPWARAYAEAAAGKHEATGVWMHKEEREADFIYSDPVLTESFVFFHLKTKKFNWKTLKDLEGLRLGGGIKYSYGPEMDQALESGQLTMERAANDQSNFAKLLLERITLYPQEMNVGYASLLSEFSKADRDKITHHPKPFLNNQSHLLFPKKLKASEVLLRKFNKRLQEYRASGRYNEYLEKMRDGLYL